MSGRIDTIYEFEGRKFQGYRPGDKFEIAGRRGVFRPIGRNDEARSWLCENENGDRIEITERYFQGGHGITWLKI